MLKRVLAKLTRVRVAVTGSGRIDAGVHALVQVASITTDAWRAGIEALLRAMNVAVTGDPQAFDSTSSGSWGIKSQNTDCPAQPQPNLIWLGQGRG